jgi:O-antigen/teichoic acid export membrane protein
MRISLGDPGTLLGRATRALGWSFFNTALARLGTLGVGIFLARLLGPHAFGTFAVAFVAMVALLSFNDLGVSAAIVRWPGEPDEIAPTVATISVISSLILYAGCFFGAPAFSAAMGAPTAAPVIRVLALNVVISGIVAVPNELLQRYFRQDRKMIADQANNWVGAGVSVGLAWSGFGAMSLGIGQLAGGLVAGVIFVVFSPLPLRFGFNVAKARELLRFGTPLAGASAVVFLVGNVDNLVVGHLLGATALGYYVLAWNLASWPVNMFSQPMRNVAPALFSRLQHDPPAMRAGFLSAASLLGSVTLPVCLLISGSALPLLEFVYGARWAPAARALVWLGVLAALRILFELIYDYFVVLAKSRTVLTVEILWLVALIPSLIAGALADGIFGVGVADVGVAGCVVLPWYVLQLRKVGIQPRALVARLWLPLAAAIGVGAAAYVASKVIPSKLADLAVSGVVALATIGLLVYVSRATIGSLRTTVGESPPADRERPAEAEPAPAVSGPRAGATISPQDRETTAEALRVLLSMAVPDFSGIPSLSSYNDVTAPIPVYRENITVKPLEWDPIRAAPRGRHARHDNESDPSGPASRPRHANPASVSDSTPRGLESADISQHRPVRLSCGTRTGSAEYRITSPPERED